MTKPPRREIEQGIYSRAFFAPRQIIQNIAGWTLTKHDKKLHWNGNPNLPLFCFREEDGHWTSWVWCSNSEQVALKSIGCATITCRSVPTFQDLLVPLLQEMACNGAGSNWFSEVRCHHRPSFYEASFLPTGLKIRHLAQEEVTVTVWPCSIFTQARITVSKHVVVSF